MQPGALFVHCGAGAVVDENALIAALRAGHLGGAALDTYTYEPIRPDDPLLALARDPLQNLMLTPHVAAGPQAANSSLRAGGVRRRRVAVPAGVRPAGAMPQPFSDRPTPPLANTPW